MATLALVFGMAGGLTACDDDGVDLDLLDQDLVVGQYDYETLAFDVSGQTFGEYDIFGAANVDPATHFLNLTTTGRAQLSFEDPETGLLDPANGSYEMTEDGVSIAFDDSKPLQLLIPRNIELTYDMDTGQLSFVEDLSVSRTRLVELVPELEDEPLNDPVPGQLTAVFTPR